MTQLDPHFQRGSLLLQQGRYELAEAELRQAVSREPNGGRPRALLALVLAHLQKFQEANDESQAAVGLAPDDDFCHYAHSVVLSSANCFPEAEAAVQEAIAIDSQAAMYFAQLALVQFEQKRWTEALTSAEQGLAIDPEHEGCVNLRSLALVKLGRRTEASGALQGALERDPEDGWTHANLGWALVERGQYEQAMEHFREALRLEPDLDHARQGIVTVLKARNPLYRPLLNYFLWVQKLKAKYAWFLIIGLYFLMRSVDQFRRANPEWSVWIAPVTIGYVAFVYTTWLGDALFNLVLCSNRFGRLALSTEQKKTSLIVGGCLAGALPLMALFWSNLLVFFAAAGILLATLPLSVVYYAESGWPRWSIAAMGVVLMLMGVCPLTVVGILVVFPTLEMPLTEIAKTSFQSLPLAALATQIGSQAIVARRPRRIILRRM